MSTIEQVWARALPPSTTVVGGVSGLAGAVSGVSVLRSRQPGFAALRGGELALLSTDILHQVDRRLTLAHALERLADVGVVAVAVRGEIDREAVAVADQRGLPLLELPPEASLREIELLVGQVLMAHRADLHDRTHELSTRLQELLLRGHGVTDVADHVALLIGRAVALEQTEAGPYLALPRGQFADRARLEATLAAGRSEALAWAGRLRAAPADPPVARFELPELALARFVAPIALPDGLVGLLSILAPPDQLGEPERLAASRGAAACALALAHERALQEREDRLQRGLLEELTGDGPLDVAALSGRAARLGYDLDAPHLGLALSLAPPNGRSNGQDLGDGPTRATELLGRDLGALSPLISLSEGGLIALLPLAPEADARTVRETARRLHQVLVAGLRPWCVSVGAAGPRAGADGLRAACREAERALKLSSQLFGRGSLTHFADLGAYRVLFRLQGTPEAESFLNEMLGALEAYDRQHHAELLPTLEAYFGASCSPQETAARLHLHRNTVLYRLQRIADISGYRLDDPSARFDLQLALRLHRALRTEAAI